MIGTAASVGFTIAPTVLRLCGLMPPNGHDAILPILVGANLMAGMAGAIPVVLATAMMADVSDEYDLRYKGRAEGLFFGVNVFCRKASLGLGGATAGLIIDLIHFPTKVAPGSVDTNALTRLGLAFGPMTYAFLMIGMVFLASYNLSRSRHTEILEGLRRRDLAKGAQAQQDQQPQVDRAPLDAQDKPSPA